MEKKHVLSKSSAGPSVQQADNQLDLDSDNEISIKQEPVKFIPSDAKKRLADEEVNVKKKPKQCQKSKSKIPVPLLGLMGEANLRIVRGDLETAKKMCFEVIRQCPEAYEPHLVLAQVYESTDFEKSFQHKTLAAILNPSDTNLWISIAQTNYDMGKPGEAVKCYSKAIAADPQNETLHRQRIKLAKIAGDSKAALRYSVRLAGILPPEKYEEIIELTSEAAKEYHANKDYIRAIEAINIPLNKCSDKVTPDTVNMMLDLLLVTKNFPACMDVFSTFCNLRIELLVKSGVEIEVLSYEMPENLVIDLKIKFVVCLIKLGCFDLATPLLNELLMEEDVETVGDLFLDTAEALMEVSSFADALKFLIPLVKSHKFSLPAVWLKHAECLKSCEMIEQAIESYKMVTNLAPQHDDAKIPLADMLLQLGKAEEAVEILTQDYKSPKINLDILMKYMDLVKSGSDIKKYLKAAEMFLWRHCLEFKHKEEIKIALRCDRWNEKLSTLKKVREFRHEKIEEKPTFVASRALTIEEEYAIFKDILKTCVNHRQFAYLQMFTFMALTSKILFVKRDEIIVFAFFACVFNHDVQNGFVLIKEFLYESPRNNLAWNWLGLLLQQPDNLQYMKQLLRLMDAQDVKRNVRLLKANYCLVVNHYTEALNCYLYFFRQEQSAYLSFMLGNVLLATVFQRSRKKTKGVVSTIVSLFYHYAQLRGRDAPQEVWYNLGRLYHQLGVYYIAEDYYRKVLDYEDKTDIERPELLSMRRVTAFNLHLIYKKSKNFLAARQVLMRHIVV